MLMLIGMRSKVLSPTTKSIFVCVWRESAMVCKAYQESARNSELESTCRRMETKENKQHAEINIFGVQEISG